jgi:hypothetical protein
MPTACKLAKLHGCHYNYHNYTVRRRSKGVLGMTACLLPGADEEVTQQKSPRPHHLFTMFKLNEMIYTPAYLWSLSNMVVRILRLPTPLL